MLPQPDAAARLAMVRTAGTLIDKHVRLIGIDGEPDGLDKAKSVLGSLTSSLQELYGDMPETTGEPL